MGVVLWRDALVRKGYGGMYRGPRSEIDDVIAFLQRQLYEPLSLSQLAQYAGYSPFHFSRIFKERMGLSPQHYVSALRLQRAKELLLSTPLSIRDIGLEIGQQSLGTFTTRFTQRVGISPSQFRNSWRQADQHLMLLQHLKHWQVRHPIASRRTRVEGVIRTKEPFEGVVLVGLFPKPIPEGYPLYGTVLSAPGRFRFTEVKPGTYYLMATSVSWKMKATEVLVPLTTLRFRSRKPIVVDFEASVPFQEVTLHPPRLDDPPILISLPLLMGRFLRRQGFSH